MAIETLGIDIAKNVFQLHGVGRNGNRSNDACQRIAKIKGVGPKTATAVVAAIGDGTEFQNDRHLAAWVGRVPRQFSSGDRKVLMGISKRGNQHLRSLLVHGARSVVRTAQKKIDPINQWVNELR
jgi:transposase